MGIIGRYFVSVFKSVFDVVVVIKWLNVVNWVVVLFICGNMVVVIFGNVLVIGLVGGIIIMGVKL